MNKFLLAIGIICVSILCMFANAYVYSYLWSWFAVPLFGLRAISITGFFGLQLLVSWFTFHPTPKELSEKEKYQQFAYAVFKPFVYLLVGFIVKQFI